MISSALILHWMLTLAPSEPHVSTFEKTAEAIAKAANEDANPIEAAATLTALGFYESHFDPSAISRNDDPTRSYGLFQISIQWARPPVPLYSQAVIALQLARDSLQRCGSLAMYASGSCHAGIEAAEERMKLAYRLMNPQYLEPKLPAVKKHHE